MAPRAERSTKSKQAVTVAGAYLALLADRGVDYLFGNAGTDFAPLIEAYAHAAQIMLAVPTLTCTITAGMRCDTMP